MLWIAVGICVGLEALPVASQAMAEHGRKFRECETDQCHEGSMNAPLKAVAGAGKVDELSVPPCARSAARRARPPARWRWRRLRKRITALAAMAKAIRGARAAILAANAEDRAEAKSGGATSAFLDRLSLDAERVDAMAAGLDVIRKLKDPVGTVMASWRRPNGMRIERVRVPLGVVGVIYESRPNVTADAGALCLKAGNAAILRGGSESFRSCRAIHAALVEGLVEAGLPARRHRARPDARS